MTSSSNPERGLDAMLIVYSLLGEHPASALCEQFIRSHIGWFTTALTLFEAKAILTKVYAVESALVSRKLAQFVAGPIEVAAVDGSTALAAMELADKYHLDLTDAVLLRSVQTRRASQLATDDRELAGVCQQMGITAETPITASVRQQMAAWEAANLPSKGLPRILHEIHGWLDQTNSSIAEEFWARTGGGSHLP